MIDIIAPPDKYFYTVDRKILTNLYQLLEYLNDCSPTNYSHHVNMQRNDFANWLRDVFRVLELAKTIQSSGSRENSVAVLKKYFDDWENSENDKTKNDSKILKKSEEEFSNTITNNKFKEWSDEELEKFSKFGKPEREIQSEDEKASYLKFELSELRNLIKELRKGEKNTLIPDLLLRTVDSKISYYVLSKSKEEYDNIIRIFNDVKRELDYCSQEQPYSFADEIIKGLELQKTTMKKT